MFLGGLDILNPVFLKGSEIVTPLLCCWGGGGVRNPESAPVGIVNFKSSPVFIGGSEILNLHFSMGEPLEKFRASFGFYMRGSDIPMKFE